MCPLKNPERGDRKIHKLFLKMGTWITDGQSEPPREMQRVCGRAEIEPGHPESQAVINGSPFPSPLTSPRFRHQVFNPLDHPDTHHQQPAAAQVVCEEPLLWGLLPTPPCLSATCVREFLNFPQRPMPWLG